MLHSLLTKWSWLRIARLALGGVAIAQGLAEQQTFILVIGGILFLQGVMNMSCSPFSKGSCEIPTSAASKKSALEEGFEVVEPEKK